MSYITERDPDPGCIFCTKAGADLDEANFIVHRAPSCFVILNLYPYNSGHLMVVPYLHVGDLRQLPPTVGSEVFAVTQDAMNVLDEAMHPEGFNCGINQGHVAGAGVADHVHLHVVPRWKGDTNFMPVLGETKVLPESLADTASKLRALFLRISDSS